MNRRFPGFHMGYRQRRPALCHGWWRPAGRYLVAQRYR